MCPTAVARVTAVTVAEAPGAREPRSHAGGALVQVPCDGVSEISFVLPENSLSLSPCTSAAATEEALVMVIVHVMGSPTFTAFGLATLVTTRSRNSGGGSGLGGAGLRSLVIVQTTASPGPTVTGTEM